MNPVTHTGLGDDEDEDESDTESNLVQYSLVDDALANIVVVLLLLWIQGCRSERVRARSRTRRSLHCGNHGVQREFEAEGGSGGRMRWREKGKVRCKLSALLGWFVWSLYSKYNVVAFLVLDVLLFYRPLSLMRLDMTV